MSDAIEDKSKSSPAKKKILIGCPWGSGSGRKELVAWLMKTVRDFERNSELSSKYELGFTPDMFISDTPVDMVRNKLGVLAIEAEADYLLMLDDDLEPDYLLRSTKTAEGPPPQPFLPTALAFAETIDGPCVIAAPYCGPPPEEFVFIFEWQFKETDIDDFTGRIEMMSRERVAMSTGFEQVAALPTGCMLIDIRALKVMPPPWFYYEMDKFRMIKASTEDVTFSRDCALARIPIYVAWDSWAKHIKTKGVGKPRRFDVNIVNEKLQEIVKRGIQPGEYITQIGDAKPYWPDLPKDLPVKTGFSRREVIIG